LLASDAERAAMLPFSPCPVKPESLLATPEPDPARIFCAARARRVPGIFRR